MHFLQLLKIEEEKNLKWISSNQTMCTSSNFFSNFPLNRVEGRPMPEIQKERPQTFNPKARVHLKDATNRWLSISVGQKLQGRSMPSVKGERSHMKENLGIWGVDSTTTFTTKMKKLDSSRDLCSGVKCDLGGSSKWIKFNRRTDRSGKLVTWYNGPLILGPICWPSQD